MAWQGSVQTVVSSGERDIEIEHHRTKAKPANTMDQEGNGAQS